MQSDGCKSSSQSWGRLLGPNPIYPPSPPSTLPAVGAVYEGTSNVQRNTIAKLIAAEYK